MPRAGSKVIHQSLISKTQTIAGLARPDTAQVKRPTRATDTGGGSTITYADVGGTTSVRIVPLSRMRAVEREVASRIQGERMVVLAFAAGTDVQLKDRVVVGARTFEVLEDMGIGHSYAVEARVLATELV